MHRDIQSRLAIVFFGLVALVSVSACAVASSPASPSAGTEAPSETQSATSIPEDSDPDDSEANFATTPDPTPEPETAEPNQSESQSGPASDEDPSSPVSVPEEAESTQDEVEPSPGAPVRLQIDAIDVDAEFEYVGVTEDGNMDVPQEWDNVAWYEPGTVPGAQGNAVVAGHYDSDVAPAIFFELKLLSTGDHVRIITDDGEELVFEVTEVESIHVDEADTRKIFGRTDERNLNLITCEGVWDRSAGMYDQRLIVYTTLVSG